VSKLASRFRSRARSEHSDALGLTTIGGRRIYILPTRYGMLFAALLLLMLIGSLNYDNNPAYLLTFFLCSVALNAMYQTWRNLRGVQLRMLHSDPVFSGQDVRLRFQLGSGDGIEHPAIQVQADEEAAIEDIHANGRKLVLQVKLPSARRGWLYPGRVTLSTRYPLGLFRAWCYVDLDERVLIYPAPAAHSIQLAGHTEIAQEGGADTIGHDDFFGLRDYRAGDSPKQIDWKSLARERGTMTKQFTTPMGQPQSFDWETLGGDTETRLSIITRAVLDAEDSALPYGLRLPGTTIEPGLGKIHQHTCLKALALFEGTAQ